ncbi:RNA-binding domain-containing protein, partial [Testicularia cyperi]
LSIRTVEADLQSEFDRIAPVEKVVIVYDARSGRSRGFGFVTMKDVDGARAAIDALNGKDLHGRRIRVDFS